MSSKQGPLSKAEKFYVEHYCFDKESRVIAEELSRSVSVIDDYINKYKALLVKAGGKIAKQSGTTIMTSAASERSDDFKATIKKVSPISHCIKKIKKDD